MQQLPTHRDLLRFNAELPDALRDRSVALRFAKPVPIRHTENFYLIRLTRNMLAGGEKDFFMPEIAQPHRVGKQLCPGCQAAMRRVSPTTFACDNPACLASRVESGPSRGVVSVRSAFEGELDGKRVSVSFIAGLETIKTGRFAFRTPLVSGCLLVLDRRYRGEVLAAVYRTAGELCERLRADGLDIAIQ